MGIPMSDRDQTSKSEARSKDAYLDKLFWSKLYISIIFGISFGVTNFTGFMSFLIYFISTTIMSSIVFNKFIASEDVEYQSEVFIEGLNVSIPAFLFTWIVAFTYNKILFMNN